MTNFIATDEVLDLLEARLSRVRFLLHGDDAENESSEQSQAGNQPLVSRLQALETSMQSLCAKSDVVKQLLHLRELSP